MNISEIEKRVEEAMEALNKFEPQSPASLEDAQAYWEGVTYDCQARHRALQEDIDQRDEVDD